jgi:hypothetical protein
MPLQASHIKFALEIKDDLKVKDLSKYITGAVYPDSRYVTKIDRLLTHDKGLIDKDFIGDDDFRKGWIAHVISDKAYYRRIKAMFPEESRDEDEKWYELNTAIKVIGDIRAAAQIGIAKYLPLIAEMGAPNGEDESLIEKHQAVMKDLYGHEDLQLEHYGVFLRNEMLLGDQAEKIMANVSLLQADKSKIAVINELFDHAVVEDIQRDWLPIII